MQAHAGGRNPNPGPTEAKETARAGRDLDDKAIGLHYSSGLQLARGDGEPVFRFPERKLGNGNAGAYSTVFDGIRSQRHG